MAGWEAFDRIEPIGERLTQLMIAQLTATVVNVLRKKGSKAVTPEELMPRYVDEDSGAAELNWRFLKARLEAITREQEKARARQGPTPAKKAGTKKRG